MGRPTVGALLSAIVLQLPVAGARVADTLGEPLAPEETEPAVAHVWDAVREQYRAELSRNTGPEVVRRRERKPERVEQLSYRPPINTTYSLEVHVIACERSLDVLFADLSTARCLRNKYQRLFIHVDACGVDSVLEQAKAYQWPCGDTTVRAAEQRRGLREMWFSVWDFMHERYLAHGDAAALVLEDDMTVSPAYAEWLQSAFDRIRESTYVLGASLSPIRVIEVSKPFARWNGNREVAGRTYLAAMPSSWGGAYWNSMAGPFMRYARARMKYHNYEAEAASSSDFSGGTHPNPDPNPSPLTLTPSPSPSPSP